MCVPELPGATNRPKALTTIGAEADLTSMNVDGFTMKWTTNDAVATEMLYLAMAPIATTQVATGVPSTTRRRSVLCSPPIGNTSVIGSITSSHAA